MKKKQTHGSDRVDKVSVMDRIMESKVAATHVKPDKLQ